MKTLFEWYVLLYILTRWVIANFASFTTNCSFERGKSWSTRLGHFKLTEFLISHVIPFIYWVIYMSFNQICYACHQKILKDEKYKNNLHVIFNKILLYMPSENIKTWKKNLNELIFTFSNNIHVIIVVDQGTQYPEYQNRIRIIY